jgi:hypothetical protein
MQVPVSIKIPKSLEQKLRKLLVRNGDSGYRANPDLTRF